MGHKPLDIERVHNIDISGFERFEVHGKLQLR